MRIARFLHQHLRLCGIGIVFLTLPAVAEIVYTPVDVAISGNGRINIDLNHGGIVDFTIAANDGHSSPCNTFYGMATLFPATGNGVVVGPLASGTLVSASDTFRTQGAQIEKFAFFSLYPGSLPPRICSPGYSSGWCPVLRFGFTTTCNVTAYVGLAFKINGQIHYGWAYLSIHVTGGAFKTTLTGFAYETVAGRGIVTGATSGN